MEKVITFENGLKLVLNQNLGLYTVTTGVYAEAGCSFEDESNNGISHFIEHNLFKGTDKRTAFEISDCVDRIGGQMNAFTSKEATCYYVKSTTEYLGFSLELLSDLLLNSKFDEVEMDKERGVILEEIAMCEDTPDDLCMDLLAKATFKNAPLGRTILGPAENIKRFNRNDVLKYMEKTYAPNNIVISIAGNFNVDEAVELVQKYYVDNMKKPSFILPKADKFEFTSSYESKVKDIEQCHIAFTFKGAKYGADDFYEHSILSLILGGGMSSRLFQSIREDKGLAYSVFAFGSAYKNVGADVVYAGVNPANVERATIAIKDEIQKMKANGITRDEFERAKAQAIGSFVFAQESSASLMNIYGKSVLMTGKAFDIQSKLAHMKNIKYEDVTALLEQSYDLSTVSASQVGKIQCDVLNVIKG